MSRHHATLALTVGALAAAMATLPSCGGGDETGASEPAQALEGARVAGRDEAVQIAARGVLAPLAFSEQAHAVLARTLEPGAVLERGVAIEIEEAENAEGMLLRGEAGVVRAVLRFERAALGAQAQVDGALVLDVSRTAAGAGLARRTRADAVSVSDGSRTLRWSYLDISVDARQELQSLVVLSDVPVDGAGSVWLDATSTAAAGRFVATGVIGFLKARLTVQAEGGGWLINVDNDKDDRVDFTVHATAAEIRAGF